MYYYRDSYFDQQISYSIARSAGRMRSKPLSAPRRVWNSVSQLLLSMTCLFVMFGVAYMVLDVFGLEHLVQFPELASMIETVEMLAPTDISFSGVTF